MKKYRMLKHGEIIQYGDERDFCHNPWHDEPEWRQVSIEDVGTPAPDPRFPAHRQYRRPTE